MGKKEETNMVFGGKPMKQIVRRDQNGEVIDWMFRIKPGNDGLSPHLFNNKPEQSHIDVFKDGQKVDLIRSAEPRPAGLLKDIITGKIIVLPSLIVSSKEQIPKDPKEAIRKYIREVIVKSK